MFAAFLPSTALPAPSRTAASRLCPRRTFPLPFSRVRVPASFRLHDVVSAVQVSAISGDQDGDIGEGTLQKVCFSISPVRSLDPFAFAFTLCPRIASVGMSVLVFLLSLTSSYVLPSFAWITLLRPHHLSLATNGISCNMRRATRSD